MNSLSKVLNIAVITSHNAQNNLLLSKACFPYCKYICHIWKVFEKFIKNLQTFLPYNHNEQLSEKKTEWLSSPPKNRFINTLTRTIGHGQGEQTSLSVNEIWRLVSCNSNLIQSFKNLCSKTIPLEKWSMIKRTYMGEAWPIDLGRMKEAATNELLLWQREFLSKDSYFLRFIRYFRYDALLGWFHKTFLTIL